MCVTIVPDWRDVNPYQELLARALKAKGVSVTFPRNYRRVLPISRDLLSGERPDLLHLHWPSAYLRSAHPLWRRAYMWRTLFDLWLIKRAGIPIVWTVHNLVTHDTPTLEPEMRFSRRLAHLVDHLIVHSPTASDHVRETFRVRADKITVIPHGSFRDIYGAAPDKSSARKALNLPPEAPVVLFFGLIRPYKGVLQLIDAWAQMPPAARRGGTLLIAGNAPDPAHAQAVRQRAAATQGVRLDMRFIDSAEVPTLLGAADLLAVPFQGSLTSGTVRLAMDYGLSIVAPQTPDTMDAPGVILAQDTGPEAFGAAVARALGGDPAGSNEAAETWDSIAATHRDIFQACRSDA